MLDSARPITGYTSQPPVPPGVQPIHFREPPSPELIWLSLRQVMMLPEHGRKLFPLPAASQNTHWIECRNFIRQAEAYWVGAKGTQGSSAALLYYYAFLNLAKAELLIAKPSAVFRQTIRHGLSYSPTRAKTIRGDILTVSKGVFPLLYEQRTGIPLTPGTRIDVSRLLNQVLEIGYELGESGIGASATVPIYHTLAHDEREAWPLICILDPGFLANTNHVTTKLILRHFHFVDLGTVPNWRDKFAISQRFMPAYVGVLESRKTFWHQGPVDRQPDFYGAITHARNVLGPYINDSVNFPSDALITPSLLKSRAFPMPASLARYALMFYASSLVRYKPSALDPSRQAATAWLLDSFTRETALPMLANALAGIRQTPIVFEPSGYRV